MSNFAEIRLVVSAPICANRRMDGRQDRRTSMTKEIGAFCDYTKTPKNLIEYCQGRQTAAGVCLCLVFIALGCQTAFQDPIFISATAKRALWR
jgi:hypothetical protein